MTIGNWLEAQRINGGPHGFEGIGRERLQHLWQAAQEAERARIAPLLRKHNKMISRLVKEATRLIDKSINSFASPEDLDRLDAAVEAARKLMKG